MSSNFDLDFNNNVENFEVEFGEVTRLTEDDFNQLRNRPSYNGNVMTGDTNIPAVPTRTSDLQNDSDYQTGADVQSAISGKQDVLTPGTGINISNDTISIDSTVVATQQNLANEVTNRENADNALQSQIDAISASSDVVDIVGTYAELQNYDTSELGDNDIIKVLQDETQGDATTYYRWSTTTQTFTLIGQEGPYYTKASADAQFVPQTRTVNGKALSSNITLNASDVSALSPSDVDTQLANSTNPVQNKVLYGLLGDMPSDFFSGEASDTQTGTDITIGEAIGLTDLKMLGDTFQQTYSGKNICSETKVENATKNLFFKLPTLSSGDIVLSCTPGTVLTGATYGLLIDGTFTQLGTWSTNSSGKLIKSISLTAEQVADVNAGTDVWIRTYKSAGGFVVPDDAMIEYGTVATDYEPYVGGVAAPNPDYPQTIHTVTGVQTVTVSDGTNTDTYTINLGSIELCKIGNYQDYIYKSGGDWYVHKEIGKVILDGTESWEAIAQYSAYFTFPNPDATLLPTREIGAISDNFIEEISTTSATQWGNYPNNCIALRNRRTNSSQIGIKTDVAANSDTFKTWLSTHNTTVYYVLATPTDTKITDQTLIDGLNSALNMTCYDGSTNIVVTSTNLPGELELTSANKTLGGIIAILRGRS